MTINIDPAMKYKHYCVNCSSCPGACCVGGVMLDPPEYQRLKEFVDPEFFLITSNKVILKTKDGQCVMWDPVYKNCTLHQLGVFTHGDYHYFKPRRCCLFPLVVTESGDDLEISLGSEFYRGDLPCDVRESEKTIMEICQSELEYYYPHRVVIK